MQAPAALALRAGETLHTVLAAGGTLPAARRVVCATQRPGQRELVLELLEGEALRPIARARFALPPGLPANCWLPVEVQVDPDLRVRASARENLRRISVEAVFEPEDGPPGLYRVE